MTPDLSSILWKRQGMLNVLFKCATPKKWAGLSERLLKNTAYINQMGHLGREVIGTRLRTKILGCRFNPQQPMPSIFQPRIAKKSTRHPQSGL